jgi:hypothetical protein
VDKSQTLIWRLWPAEKSNLSFGLRAKAVGASESVSIVDLIEAFEESTILIDSPDAHAMNEPSDETA